MTERRITMTWPGGEHEFELGWDALRAIETALDAGPLLVFRRLNGLDWRTDDATTVLRHGLIGAGMEAVAAKSLIAKTAERCVPAELLTPAMQILGVGIFGVGATSDGEGRDEEAPVELVEPGGAA